MPEVFAGTSQIVLSPSASSGREDPTTAMSPTMAGSESE
jgi:hypothetical protein